MKDSFNFGEQEVLDNLRSVIENLTKDLDKGQTSESNVTESRGYARVLTPSGISRPNNQQSEERPLSPYGYNIDGDITKSSGTSYVLVVAAIVALILIVFIISTTLLNMIPEI